MANTAADLLVWFKREGDNGDEAEGKPLPALHNGCSMTVAAVLALRNDILCAFERGGEGYFVRVSCVARCIWEGGGGTCCVFRR